MSPVDTPGRVYVLRHGETPWSRDRRHTGRTDISLTTAGRASARAAGRTLAALRGDRPWALALASPLSRAADTAALAGIEVDRDYRLVEWDYGDYDGITTAQIRSDRPGWDLWRNGCPNGEQLVEVTSRVESVLSERVVPASDRGDVLLVAHSHLLRVLVARWLVLPADAGRHFVLDPAGIGVLGYEHEAPALLGWNISELTPDASHRF